MAVSLARSASRRPNQRLDREFQAAVAQYNAGNFPEAAAQLENLLHEVPESFEVHELLGLVYSGESKDALANPHLRQRAPEAKFGRCANKSGHESSSPGKLDDAQEQLKKAVALDPQNFDANHDLGELYVRMGKLLGCNPISETGTANHSVFLRQWLRFGAGLSADGEAGARAQLVQSF